MAESKTEVIVDILGWTAGAYGTCVALPQIARVVRARSTAGISRLAWQSSLASNLSWVAYGALTRHLNLWLPCLLVASCAVGMLIMIERDRRPGLIGRIGGLDATTIARTFALPLVVAAIALSLATTIGALGFSVLVFIAAAVAQLLQLRSLMMCRDISAVSVPYLAMGVLGQVLWFGWGVLAGDISNELVAGCLTLLTAANVTCYLLRRAEVLEPRRLDLPRWAGALQLRPVLVRGRVRPVVLEPAVADAALTPSALEESVLPEQRVAF